MKLVGLTTYGINVRNAEQQQLELHNIFGRSLIDIIYDTATVAKKTYENNKEEEAVFTFDEVKKEIIRNEDGQDLYQILYLRVKTGEYGTESEIVDSTTGDLVYTRNPRQADVMPFGCCIIIPCGEYVSGVIVLQSLGRMGISTVMKKRLNEYVRAVNGSLRFVMGTIVPKVYLERFFKNGILKAVRLIRYGIPDDDADRYGVDKKVKSIVEERIIRKPTGFLRNKTDALKECIAGTRRYDEVVQIDGFEIDDLKLEFGMGKRNKTISLKNIDNITASEDISEDVIIENGHPTFDSLCEVMKETGEFYLRAKGLLL
ncbi:hypothetical protein [Hungatella effluvii]|uniref:hypothetical protein n=1 Tax=Hungatella effluvii TaxID=1096246 RepID=UPI002A82CF43|nr:hypothetical protein [Hungatella effluvii]